MLNTLRVFLIPNRDSYRDKVTENHYLYIMGSLFLTYLIKKKENKLFPHFTYVSNNKKTKIFSGVNCEVVDWNRDKKQVRRSDKDYKKKNLQIDVLRTKLEALINRYKNNDEYSQRNNLNLS